MVLGGSDFAFVYSLVTLALDILHRSGHDRRELGFYQRHNTYCSGCIFKGMELFNIQKIYFSLLSGASGMPETMECLFLEYEQAVKGYKSHT